jgi:hypothetical protein
MEYGSGCPVPLLFFVRRLPSPLTLRLRPMTRLNLVRISWSVGDPWPFSFSRVSLGLTLIYPLYGLWLSWPSAGLTVGGGGL